MTSILFTQDEHSDGRIRIGFPVLDDRPLQTAGINVAELSNKRVCIQSLENVLLDVVVVVAVEGGGWANALEG